MYIPRSKGADTFSRLPKQTCIREIAIPGIDINHLILGTVAPGIHFVVRSCHVTDCDFNVEDDDVDPRKGAASFDYKMGDPDISQ